MNEFLLNSGTGSALMTIRSPSSLNSSKRSSRLKHTPSLPSISKTDSKSSLRSYGKTTPSHNEEIEKKLKETQIELEEIRSELFKLRSDSSRQSISMKSFQNSESMFSMNWEDLDVFELKKILLGLVSQASEVYKNLQYRCGVVMCIIKNLQDDETGFSRDSNTLLNIVRELSESLETVSQTELELGLKSRELAKKTLEVSQIRYRMDALNKRYLRSEIERKEIQEKFRRLQEDHNKLIKTNMIEKQRYSRKV